MNPVMMHAFCDELEKISMDKESILGPRQALQIAGGVKGLMRSAGKKLGLKGATKVRPAVSSAAPAIKMVDPAAIKAETAAALKANPKLQAATKQFPQSTKATTTRPGYSLTPAKSTAIGRPSRQMPVPKGATPTMVGDATAAVGSTATKPTALSMDAMLARKPGVKHGPFRPSRAISARAIRRGKSLPQRVGG